MNISPNRVEQESGKDLAPGAVRVVLMVGVPASASTWAFNVARELMIAAFGPTSVAGGFCPGPNTFLAEPMVLGRRLVCKTHGWKNLHVFAYLTAAAVIVTVRDPRDCALSMMERFGFKFAQAAYTIFENYQHATICGDAGHPVLRYEDRFFEDPATVRVMARHLGVEVSDGVAAKIFDNYRTEVVRALAAAIPSQPKNLLATDGKTGLHSLATQIHERHVGDGRVGKWRERFDARQRTELTRLFAPILTRFGYPPE
jgi:hypothetical protein